MPEDFKEGDELLVLSNFSSRTTDNLDALSLSDGQQGTVTSLFLASFDSDNLKFTCEIWRPTNNGTEKESYLIPEIKVIESKCFPYLDLQMHFSIMGKLRFQVHLKKNQALKYLNSESTHTCACMCEDYMNICSCLA